MQFATATGDIRPSYSIQEGQPATSSGVGRAPGVIGPEQLEGVFRNLQARFGGPRKIGPYIVGPAVTEGA